MVQPPFAEYQYANYEYFVTKLRSLFPSGGNYYISGAPQCVIPDARLGNALSKSWFDFVFVQFYNTLMCNTREGYNGLTASSTTFTFDNWVTWLKGNSKNPAFKIYLGMPAGVGGAPNDPTSFLSPSEANDLITHYKNKHSDVFGGVMLWEATVNANNPYCGKPYGSQVSEFVTCLYQAETRVPTLVFPIAPPNTSDMRNPSPSPWAVVSTPLRGAAF